MVERLYACEKCKGDAVSSSNMAFVPTELLERMLDIAVNARDRKRVGKEERNNTRRRVCISC